MSKRLDNFIIASKQNRGDGFYLLELTPQEHFTEMPEVEPGQFVEISVTDSGKAFLRRPISICDFDAATGRLTLLVKAVGKGTEWITSLPEGSVLNLIWPLGQGFTLPEEAGGTYLLCGGGVGVAPLLYLGKKIRERGARPIFVLGARNASQLMLIDRFALYGEVRIMTDDGSAGEKGLVTDGLRKVIEREKVNEVVTIGPAIMMKFVAKLTKEYGIPTVCSLNTIMVDGTGMCGACRVTVDGKTRFVCVDGPEFDAHKVDFDQMMTRLKAYNS